jgi:hypothetical protein
MIIYNENIFLRNFAVGRVSSFPHFVAPVKRLFVVFGCFDRAGFLLLLFSI